MDLLGAVNAQILLTQIQNTREETKQQEPLPVIEKAKKEIVFITKKKTIAEENKKLLEQEKQKREQKQKE